MVYGVIAHSYIRPGTSAAGKLRSGRAGPLDAYRRGRPADPQTSSVGPAPPELTSLVNSVLLMLTVPDAGNQPVTEALLRPCFGMHRFEWPDDESVAFGLGDGDMIRLLRECGLEVEDLELRPEPGAETRYPFVTLDWARQWPCEEVWKARKTSLKQPAPPREITHWPHHY